MPTGVCGDPLSALLDHKFMFPWLTSRSAIRFDQYQCWKRGAVAAHIAGEQRQPVDGGMGSDEEVGQHAGARSARIAELRKYLSSEKQGSSWHRSDFETGFVKKRVEILDAVISSAEIDLSGNTFWKSGFTEVGT